MFFFSKLTNHRAMLLITTYKATLKQYRHIPKCSRAFTSKVGHLVNRQISPTTLLYEKHKDAILYSSFIEQNNRTHFGFRKKYIIDNILKKEKEQHDLVNRHVKPFSVALKYLDFNESLYSISEQQPNPNVEPLPPPPPHNATEVKPPTAKPDWMADYESYDESEHSSFGTPGKDFRKKLSSHLEVCFFVQIHQ